MFWCSDKKGKLHPKTQTGDEWRLFLVPSSRGCQSVTRSNHISVSDPQNQQQHLGPGPVSGPCFQDFESVFLPRDLKLHFFGSCWCFCFSCLRITRQTWNGSEVVSTTRPATSGSGFSPSESISWRLFFCPYGGLLCSYVRFFSCLLKRS